MTIGEKIVKLRKEAKISQEKMAEKLEITRQTLANWESDITSPDLKQSKKIAQLFKVSLDELTGNQTILESKLLNLEKVSKKQVKFLKVLLLTIYLIVLICILGLAIYFFTLRDFTNRYQQEFHCRLKDEEADISLELGGDSYLDAETHEIVSENEIYKIRLQIYKDKEFSDSLTLSGGYSLKEAVDSLNYLKKMIISSGGTCK